MKKSRSIETTPKRGRPPNMERRAAILEAAKKCLAQKGLYGTTMRDIAAQTGISEALLNRYFANRDALLAELREQVIDRLDVFLIELRRLNEASDLETYLSNVAQLYAGFVTEVNTFYLYWLMDRAILEPYTETLGDLVDVVRRTVAEGLERRTQAASDLAQQSASVLLAAIFSISMFRERLGVVNGDIPATVRLILRALRAE
jgi:AcrR family transcriptional regulator